MRMTVRTIMIIALLWIGVLLSGYGVLVGSKENAAGLGLQCRYLTAQGFSDPVEARRWLEQQQ